MTSRVSEIDFFFDPICPWAWQASELVRSVASQDGLVAHWRFISLRIVNAERNYESEMPEGYLARHEFGRSLLRIAAACRAEGGDALVDRFYRACGEVLHVAGRRDDLAMTGDVHPVLEAADVPREFGAAATDERYDAVVNHETALALDRAGPDLGTPIITLGTDGPSFFGPILSRVPAAEDALEVWALLVATANIPGFAELKRTRRDELRFRSSLG